MNLDRFGGLLMCAAVLASSACGRRYEPKSDWGFAVEEPNGGHLLVTARGGSDNEIPAGSLQRLSDARTPSIHLDTLKVDFQREGDRVIATAYALTVPHGNPHRYEDAYKPLLGVHSARLGQVIQLKELSKLGYVPITYKVVSAKAPEGPRIAPVSHAPSIAVGVLEENIAMSRLDIHNSSAKDVVAVALISGNSLMMETSHPERPLIPAGTTNTREIPSTAPIVLTAALFADGTHQGDPQLAATLYATQLGRETEERLADPLIRRIIAVRGIDDPAKFEQIRSALSGLSITPKVSMLREMHKSFPDLPSATLKKELSRGLDEGRRDLWSSLYEFEHQNAVYPPPKTHPPIERWWPTR